MRKREIIYVDPQTLFLSHGPVIPVVDISLYEDRSEVGLETYLDVLPSVGLYGFKYAVLVNRKGVVVDGNFRVYCALELGFKVPVCIVKKKDPYPWAIRFVLRRVRRLLRNNSLFRRKEEVTDKKFDLRLSGQRNIL